MLLATGESVVAELAPVELVVAEKEVVAKNAGRLAAVVTVGGREVVELECSRWNRGCSAVVGNRLNRLIRGRV